MDEKSQKAIPVTFYAEKIEFDAKPDLRRRETIMDIEIDRILARRIVSELSQRINDGFPGTIRFRLHGRILH